jgi:hypothetical protein
MTTSIRHLSVVNSTGRVLLSSDIPNDGGDEKQVLSYHRTLSAADIGDNAGQTRHADGCLLFVLPTNLKNLCVQILTYRISNNGETRILIDSQTTADHYFLVNYTKNALNEFRIRDLGDDASTHLVAGDVVECIVVAGS